MARVDKQPTVDSWRDWLNELGGWFSALVNDAKIAHDFFGLSNHAPNRDSGRDLIRWIQRSHEAYLAIGIRRLVDDDKKTYSFFRFLNHLQHHHKSLTLSVLLKDTPESFRSDREAHIRDYWGIVSAEEPHVSATLIGRHLESLRKIRGWVGHYDQHLIHLQNSPSKGAWMTWQRFHRCVAILDRHYCDYYLLLNGASLSTSAAVSDRFWKTMFLKPWLQRTPNGLCPAPIETDIASKE